MSRDPVVMPAEIAIVLPDCSLGGTERHLAQVLARLDRARFRPVVFAFSAYGPVADDFRAGGIELVSLAGDDGPDWRRRRGWVLRGAWRLLRELRRRRTSLVHFFLPPAYLVGAPAALLARTPRRLMSRRSLNEYQAKYPAVAWLERQLHRRMARVLGNSAAVVAELRREGVAEARLRLLPNGVDLGRFENRGERAEVRAEWGVGEEVVVFVVVANLIPYKGHSDLLRALGRVRSRLPAAWKLVCVGRDDGIEGELEALARVEGIADRVAFLGSRTDVPRLLAGADVGLLCSHQEGFSNSVIESMAAGLPMLVTAVGGNAEAVLDGVTGRVVPPHDIDAIGEALVALARDPAGRRRMGEAARRRVEETYSLPACVAGYEALYSELLWPDVPGAPSHG